MYTTGSRRVTPTDPVECIAMWPVATAPHDDTLRQAAEALATDEVGVLAVIENGRLIGLVSERDVTRHLAEGANPDHVTVGEAMTTELVAVRNDDSIGTAARTMLDAGVRHLPVHDDEGVAGMVSMRDVVEVLLAAVEAEGVVELPSGARVVLRAREP